MDKKSFGGYCICPLRQECVGAGCADLARQLSGVPAGTAELTAIWGFDGNKCPTCRCGPPPSAAPAELLVMLDGAEGMSSWRYSVAEMLFMARLTARRLVLPCVAHGRLVPCLVPGALPMETYVNTDQLRRYHPHIMPFSALIDENRSTGLLERVPAVFCLHHKCRFPHWIAGSPDGLRPRDGLGLLGHNATVRKIYNRNLFLTAHDIARTKVALMARVFRSAIQLGAMRARGAVRNAGGKEDYGVLQAFAFARSAYLAAEALRDQLRLPPRYIAVHWRSERTACNYSACSAELAAGVERMLSRSGPAAAGTGCLLVSDIPYDAKKSLWGEFAKTDATADRLADQARALRTLGVIPDPATAAFPAWGGCRKLDQLESVRTLDIGLISIYDKILAARADKFFTCRDSSRKSVCGKCARSQSNFALEIVGLRHKEQRATYRGWPRSGSTGLALATGATILPRKLPNAGAAGAAGAPAAPSCRVEAPKYVPKSAQAGAAGGSDDGGDLFAAPGSGPGGAPRLRVPRPPVLWTFPGSGNTWCRMVLEQATGFATGSVYQDPSLKKIFKAEGAFTRRDLIAVKAHPNIKAWSASKLQHTFGAKAPLLLVVRDPLRAIWSECQRRITRALAKRRRPGRRPAGGAMHTMKLAQSWLLEPGNWIRWAGLAHKLAADYTRMWVDYKAHIAGGAPHLFVEYERLADRRARDGALRAMLGWLGSGWDKRKVECAFDAAEDDRIRRKASGSAAAPDGDALISDAFPAAGEPERVALLCQVWAALRPSEQIARQLGYPWNYTALGRPCV